MAALHRSASILGLVVLTVLFSSAALLSIAKAEEFIVCTTVDVLDEDRCVVFDDLLSF
jgi:hypothetical protein